MKGRQARKEGGRHKEMEGQRIEDGGSGQWYNKEMEIKR